jgi:murein DD-endopeptidase MepM/ murein hydrolase activator NlpD
VGRRGPRRLRHPTGRRAFPWPVAGGYISQYFHYGHYAIDIAADPGTRVMAAASGTVIFAGWKNNGGGYQVWIAHGSNLYTTYNHMSAITVGRGQSVSRGQQVGRVGMTGNATGPHLHFEVWRGPVWDGGVRVNPLIYL